MKIADLSGIQVAFEDEGAGHVLLLVHGHPFDRSMWYPQIAAFASAHQRVIAPDLRGYGESTVVAGKTTLDVFARDLETLLQTLDVHKPVVICGLSMGGQIAMEFCRLYPERVAGLVLAATFPRKETEEGKRSRAETAARLLREGMRPVAREILPKMLAAKSIQAKPGLAHYVQQMMNAAPPAGAAAALLGRAERPGYEEVLATLRCPALIVVGDQDAFTTRKDAETMKALLENSKLVWMAGIGHMPNLESEAQFNAALGWLLDRVWGQA